MLSRQKILWAVRFPHGHQPTFQLDVGAFIQHFGLRPLGECRVLSNPGWLRDVFQDVHQGRLLGQLHFIGNDKFRPCRRPLSSQPPTLRPSPTSGIVQITTCTTNYNGQQRPQFWLRGRSDSNPGNPEANSQAQSALFVSRKLKVSAHLFRQQIPGCHGDDQMIDALWLCWWKCWERGGWVGGWDPWAIRTTAKMTTNTTKFHQLKTWKSVRTRRKRSIRRWIMLFHCSQCMEMQDLKM